MTTTGITAGTIILVDREHTFEFRVWGRGHGWLVNVEPCGLDGEGACLMAAARWAAEHAPGCGLTRLVVEDEVTPSGALLRAYRID